MLVKVINKSTNNLPAYATEMSAGMDLRAYLEQPVILHPFERKIIPTGLSIELPKGYEAQIRPRSGLAISKGITVLNSPGTIDADYRGDIGVIIINLSTSEVIINHGDRIAQMVISKHEQISWDETKILSQTERGDGGFGHSGVK